MTPSPPSPALEIRRIEPRDDPAIAAIIRRVLGEYGADGPGFAFHDAEIDAMSAAYAAARAGYWVVCRAGRVVGGAGFAPLEGGAAEVCELRKMYLLPDTRGLGAGRHLLRLILERATAAGFSLCYLETLAAMDRAQSLYRSVGFRPIDRPLGATGHFGCDRWFVKDLVDADSR